MVITYHLSSLNKWTIGRGEEETTELLNSLLFFFIYCIVCVARTQREVRGAKRRTEQTCLAKRGQAAFSKPPAIIEANDLMPHYWLLTLQSTTFSQDSRGKRKLHFFSSLKFSKITSHPFWILSPFLVDIIPKHFIVICQIGTFEVGMKFKILVTPFLQAVCLAVILQHHKESQTAWLHCLWLV